MSNLTIRILVAVVGIPLILLLTLAGGFYFFGLIAIVSGVGLYEYYSLARVKGIKPQVVLGLVFGFCVNAVFIHDKLQRALLETLAAYSISVPLPSMAQLFLIEFLLFIPLILLLELFRNSGSALANVASTVTGVCYVSMSLGSLVGLRELFVPNDMVYEWGAMTVIAVFASIWVCDSVAYFAGRALGKHKLSERVSPKKTWEGAVAGFIGAVGAFVVARYLALPYMSLASALICGGVVGVFGQFGDMVESLLKRDAGVKDSSSLIPGHGGVLDRFDSLIFVSPLIFFYLNFVVF
ncbi:MAG: phosphatidate cytidylyltransferase [Bacteroidota bacterium]